VAPLYAGALTVGGSGVGIGMKAITLRVLVDGSGTLVHLLL
jgi:hypothetical protein